MKDPSEYPGLEVKLRQIAKRIKKDLPPDLGFAMFLMHLGPTGGIAYVSSVERADMVRGVIEWLYRVGMSDARSMEQKVVQWLYLSTRTPNDQDYDPNFNREKR